MQKSFTILFISFVFFSCLSVLRSQIDITKPTYSDVMIIGSHVDITWKTNETPPYTLEYSNDNNTTWTLISDKITQKSYQWLVPELDIPKVQFRVSSKTYIAPRLLIEKLNAHAGEIRSAQISKDGSTIMTASKDLQVKLWNINDLSLKATASIPRCKSIYNASFFHNKDTVLITATLEKADGSEFNAVVLWDAKSNIFTNYALELGEIANGICAHPEESIFAVSSHDGHCRVYSTETGNVIKDYLSQNNREIYSVRFSRDGKKLAWADYQGVVYYTKDWRNANTFQTVADNPSAGNVIWGLDFCDSDSKIATGGVRNNIRLYDINTNLKIQEKFNAHGLHIRSVNSSPRDNTVLTGALDKFFSQWDEKSLSLVQTPKGVDKQILSATFSPTGDTILTAGRGGGFELWRNFEYNKIEAISETNVAYRIVIRIPHITAKLNELIEIPILTKYTYTSDKFLSKLINFETRIELSNEMLDIQIDKQFIDRFNDLDQVHVDKKDVAIKELLFVYKARVLLSGMDKSDITLSADKIYGDMLDIEIENGSINVLPFCDGLSETIQAGHSQAILQVYPNPISEHSKISLNVIENGEHSLSLYNEMGEKVKIILSRFLSHGLYNIKVADFPQASGVYFLKFKTPTDVYTKKLIVVD